ncbi:MAG: four-carbon acid sugar kinase family protein [Alphaproteobacteria bacterium]
MPGCARGAPATSCSRSCSTFDSTDAGNIGQVLDALRDDAGEAIALVTPAFPETGRSVFQGILYRRRYSR